MRVVCLRFYMRVKFENQIEKEKRNAFQGVGSGVVSRVYATVVLHHRCRCIDP